MPTGRRQVIGVIAKNASNRGVVKVHLAPGEEIDGSKDYTAGARYGVICCSTGTMLVERTEGRKKLPDEILSLAPGMFYPRETPNGRFKIKNIGDVPICFFKVPMPEPHEEEKKAPTRRRPPSRKK